MLSACSSFATSLSLVFNASKTQLIRFSCTSGPPSTSFFFNGHKLDFSCSVKHLGHILCSNLSDTEDIERVKKDLTRKANCMLHSFSCCNPLVKTKLFSSFCLPLYGSALWSSSASALKSLEITYSNIVRKIWSLPCMSHTSILHQVAKLDSIYNIVILGSSKFVSSALKSQSELLCDVFAASSHLAYTSAGYNSIYCFHHKKVYTEQDFLCANPDQNFH